MLVLPKLIEVSNLPKLKLLSSLEITCGPTSWYRSRTGASSICRSADIILEETAPVECGTGVQTSFSCRSKCDALGQLSIEKLRLIKQSQYATQARLTLISIGNKVPDRRLVNCVSAPAIRRMDQKSIHCAMKRLHHLPQYLLARCMDSRDLACGSAQWILRPLPQYLLCP